MRLSRARWILIAMIALNVGCLVFSMIKELFQWTTEKNIIPLLTSMTSIIDGLLFSTSAFLLYQFVVKYTQTESSIRNMVLSYLLFLSVLHNFSSRSSKQTLLGSVLFFDALLISPFIFLLVKNGKQLVKKELESAGRSLFLSISSSAILSRHFCSCEHFQQNMLMHGIGAILLEC